MQSNITFDHKQKIKDFYNNLKTLHEFCDLLNYCQKLLYSEIFIEFDESKIRDLSRINSKKRYYYFELPKKNGEMRVIHAPKKELKILLQCINCIFNCIYTPHESAYGFIQNLSIVDGANLHLGSNYVFNIDLKDFFHSIEIGRILRRLNFYPFNLSEEYGRKEIGNYIAWLACENIEIEKKVDEQTEKKIKRVLPQGSPLSPILTNIICERLDRKLLGLSRRFGVKYTRYADDITFSSMHNVYQSDGIFRMEVEAIIKDQYFTINQQKVRLQKSKVRQVVTGITVNKKMNVSKSYIKKLRLWINFWEKYGSQKAFTLFIKSYGDDKGYNKSLGSSTLFMENVIEGKLNFLKMVKGEHNTTYIKLKIRFENLSSKNKLITETLELWEKEGIERAMEQYYKKVNK
ncbi:reverse transcriptase domain-containing protein [Chryseobacterium salviniae]|uniref:RNA-directed DNA polymerase n=1 Tax=Chryseobacterium salviniae TaxID=3101750 RepID=A0ABU6HTU5_9FLAO|nr:reverse transcriptase domain-containing protein [Chryseobacterium sp. T9W2-O]MEC3876485.1 reverse transcriptase domain-containing protein [Chryseobacterium sp. T9W2-O]